MSHTAPLGRFRAERSLRARHHPAGTRPGRPVSTRWDGLSGLSCGSGGRRYTLSAATLHTTARIVAATNADHAQFGNDVPVTNASASGSSASARCRTTARARPRRVTLLVGGRPSRLLSK